MPKSEFCKCGWLTRNCSNSHNAHATNDDDDDDDGDDENVDIEYEAEDENDLENHLLSLLIMSSYSVGHYCILCVIS